MRRSVIGTAAALASLAALTGAMIRCGPTSASPPRR
jgi:hypothetical protein